MNNTKRLLKHTVALGLVIGWGNLNGVVSSYIYLVREDGLRMTSGPTLFIRLSWTVKGRLSRRSLILDLDAATPVRDPCI